jgi:membrane protease YdiL (CAAX protease family)
LDQDPVSPIAESITPASPAQRTQSSALHKIFIGEDGLRAGWSAAIFLVLFGCVLGAGIFGAQKLRLIDLKHTGSTLSLMFGYVNEGLSAFAVLLASWIMSKIERRGFAVYGYNGRSKIAHFVAGVVSGIFLISLLVLILWKGGFLAIENRLIFGSGILRYGALWLPVFILVGIFEESLTRGYLLFTLARGFAGIYQWAFKTRYSAALGFWTAAFILSIVFFLGHTSNPGESPVGLLSVFIAGLFFSLSVWWTGSLWWGIGMHAAWDWGQSFLFGVADSGIMVQHHLLATHPAGPPVLSGGTTGPEGSIFILGVLALGSLIIVFTLPKARYGAGMAAGHSVQPAQPASAAF